MANKDDYLTTYREFFENFAETVNPNDQLPVKLGSYKLLNLEVVGGIIDWTSQYLAQKKCPQNLMAPLIHIIIEETRKFCRKEPTTCGFNPSTNLYEPLKLMQTVVAKTNEICLRYLDNSMLCSLPAPAYSFYAVNASASKNKRRKMEDKHVVIHDLSTIFNIQEASPSSYYAVFDGHAGHSAAEYSATHLHQYLAESQYYLTNPQQALLDAFCKTDSLYVEKSKEELHFSSGTTAVVALVRPKEKVLYIAWAGDSQAILVRNRCVISCVNPHKPCRDDERERIEKEGGFVSHWGTWRVNGQLAVSRAIGDPQYKPYVTAVPEIREIAFDGTEDFLVLACDGLWDYLSEEDAAKAVYRTIFLKPEETDRISGHLVQFAKKRGSADNISVIVVYLREPSKIVAEALRANRNGSPFSMDASLDNANNPFANSNGDNILQQKNPDGGLLLDLTETLKSNGDADDLTPEDFIGTNKETANGKRTSAFGDDDFGPETDVDALDDGISPSILAAKALAEGKVNNNPEDVFNPFAEKGAAEEGALEVDLDLQKQQSSEFDGERSPREETPTPPADAVHDGGVVDENLADSGEESEDEWNYIKGDEADKNSLEACSQPDLEVAEIFNRQKADTEDEDNMSHLNPNAAEFVPASPTRSNPSPVGRIMNDPILAQSPKRPNEVDIDLPHPGEFESEIKSRPSDVAVLDTSVSNGHGHPSEGGSKSPDDLMENLVNGRNIDDIPEFQPGTSPTRVPSSLQDEFHFGPNATPFTPSKFMDQSQGSTTAVYGDDSTIDADSSVFSFRKDEDPMSMSFYQTDKPDDEESPVDLNKLQQLPDNLDEFLSQGETPKEPQSPLITDLDKDADKENVPVPLVTEGDLLGGVSEITNIGDTSDKAKSPEPQIPQVDTVDFLSNSVVQPEITECSLPKSPVPASNEELLCEIPKSPAVSEDLPKSPAFGHSPEPQEVCQLQMSPMVLSPEPVCELRRGSPLADSPLEDITSSVKDISPVASPMLDLIEEHPQAAAVSSPLYESAPILLGETPKSPTDTESIATADVNSFLNRSDLTDVASPIFSPEPANVEDSSVCEIKTENIVPEFAEAAVLSPSAETPSAETVEAPIVPVVAATATVVAAAAAVASTKKPSSATAKPKTPTAAAKKTPTNQTMAAKRAPPAATTRISSARTAATSTAATRTAAARPAAAAASRPGGVGAAAPKPTPRPKVPPITKKPLTNGVPTATRTFTGATKKPTEPPKPSTARMSVGSRPSSTSARPATAPAKAAAVPPAPRPRPSTLTSRTTGAAAKTTTTSAARVPTPKTTSAAPKAAMSPLKPRPTTVPAKPRVPLTSRSLKSTTADADKQSKESANKLVAARTTSTTTRTSSTTGGRTVASTTVRKTDTKTTTGATRTTVTRTSSTTLGAKAGVTKKPQEIVRSVPKTKPTTTKVEKPIENGVGTVVTQEITVVNNAVNSSSENENLVKDNSPIDNKLIVEANIAD